MEHVPLQVTLEQLATAVVVHASGDISAMNISPLRDAIATAIAKNPGKVIIDLSQTSFLSSPGLAVLVQALQLSQRGNTKLILAAANERVRGIFEIARLTDVFTMMPTVQAAAQ